MPHLSCNRRKSKLFPSSTDLLPLVFHRKVSSSPRTGVSPTNCALRPLLSPTFVNFYSLALFLNLSSTGSFLHTYKHIHISFVWQPPPKPHPLTSIWLPFYQQHPIPPIYLMIVYTLCFTFSLLRYQSAGFSSLSSSKICLQMETGNFPLLKAVFLLSPSWHHLRCLSETPEWNTCFSSKLSPPRASLGFLLFLPYFTGLCLPSVLFFSFNPKCW